jgi:hypothetical protein
MSYTIEWEMFGTNILQGKKYKNKNEVIRELTKLIADKLGDRVTVYDRDGNMVR